MAKEWRNLCNEELHNLYCLSNIGMIRLSRINWVWYVAYRGGERMMSWVGHLTYRGEERSSYKVFVGKLEVKPLLRLGKDVRIILRCI